MADHIHRYIAPADPAAPTLLLLHGTGGNEDDLIPLGQVLAPGAGLLSPRGNTLEHGMPRFFKRLAEGVFDLDDLRERTEELAGFIAGAGERYGFDPARMIAVGFSNGANIAASLLFRRPGLLRGAALLRPMVPFQPESAPNLEGTSVLVIGGRIDRIVPAANTAQLARMLEAFGADVEVAWIAAGHGLTSQDVEITRKWLAGVGA
jgi:predicted esterase